jgi:hypothetical protein
VIISLINGRQVITDSRELSIQTHARKATFGLKAPVPVKPSSALGVNQTVKSQPSAKNEKHVNSVPEAEILVKSGEREGTSLGL